LINWGYGIADRTIRSHYVGAFRQAPPNAPA
jgi:hypothetical protein